MDKIAVLIPCYNEEKSIGNVIKDFKKNLPEAKIYVYDNNSTDNTMKNAKSLGAIVREESRQGKGNVVRTMFKEIDAEVYLLVDGDDTYSVKFAKLMCDAILYEKYDMVIGDRLSSTYFKENKRLFHNFGNKLVKNIVNFLFEGSIGDVLSGYRAFSYDFVKTFPILSKNFEIETEMTIHALDKNLKIKNIPVDYKERSDGSESKLNTYKDGIKILKTIFSLYKNYKPFQFFNVISVVFFIISLIIFYLLMIDFRISIFIFCCLSILFSVVSFFCGLAMDNISKIEKRFFEDKFINIKRGRNVIEKKDAGIN